MLQRVKKQDVKPDSWVRPEPLDYCLMLWKEWMGKGGHRSVGSLVMGGLAGDADGHGGDLHEAQHRQDMEIGAATNAMIDSLDRIHVWAIYASCGISTSWRYPNADLAIAASDARSSLEIKLRANGCTSNLY